MSPFPLRIAVAIVRGWTRLYTWRMDPALREARRAEIESDLWEQHRAEAHRPALVFQIIARAANGVLDDLLWRVEHARADAPVRRRMTIALTSVAAIIALWAAIVGRPEAPPQPPPSILQVQLFPRRLPPPPPPPPPPPRPATAPAR